MWGGLEVKIVNTLRWLVSHVVVGWVSVLSEAAHTSGSQHSLNTN